VGIGPPVSFLFPLFFILGQQYAGGDIGNETEEPWTPPRLARTLPLTHGMALIGTFVPAPSTYVPFFSWRKGLTLCPNGTSGGGAVHSFAPQLDWVVGRFFDRRQHTLRSRVYWQCLRGPFFSDGEIPSGETQLGALLLASCVIPSDRSNLAISIHSDE